MTTTNRIIPSAVDLGDDIRGLRRQSLRRVQTTSAAVAAHDEKFRPRTGAMWVSAAPVGLQHVPSTTTQSGAFGPKIGQGGLPLLFQTLIRWNEEMLLMNLQEYVSCYGRCSLNTDLTGVVKVSLSLSPLTACDVHGHSAGHQGSSHSPEDESRAFPSLRLIIPSSSTTGTWKRCGTRARAIALCSACLKETDLLLSQSPRACVVLQMDA